MLELDTRPNFGEAMDTYYSINELIKEQCSVGTEIKISDAIKLIAQGGFDPLEVKEVLMQGILKNNYVITKSKTPFLNSTVKIKHQQTYKCSEIKKPSCEETLAISIPPYHESTVKTALRKQQINYVSLYDLFIRLINSAKTSIMICSPFFDLYELTQIQNLFIKKATEGVKISILIRQPTSPKDEDSLRMKSLKRFKERLTTEQLKTNITFRNYHFEDQYEHVLSSIHSKIILIDQKVAYIGSGEIRKNSFEKNFEMGLSIDDDAIVSRIGKIYDVLFQIAKPI